MVREAQRAGLRFDEDKVRALHCAPDEHDHGKVQQVRSLPQIVEPTASDPSTPQDATKEPIEAKGEEEDEEVRADDVNYDELPTFHRKLALATSKGRIHDVLCRKNGVNAFSVLAWNFMEYLPLRRMDLQHDGSWKPIMWPLPKGEVRDIPDNVVVHNSVIKRMLHDPTYRPGNLIVGGGGRGVRVAPEEYGIGKWKVLREEGDWIGECYIRAEPPPGSRTNSTVSGVKKLFGERKKSE
jgi:hypothetical protein